jgi:outer membrane immunogenic protein
VALASWLAAGSALAADMPVRKAPVAAPAPAPLWSGMYVGLQGGWGFGRAQQREVSFRTGDYSIDGGLLGVTWGTNWQVGRAVFGIESDFAFAMMRGSTDGASSPFGPCGGVPANCDAKLQWFGTTRARLGQAFDNYLLYVTGGAAWASIRGSEGNGLAIPPVGAGTQSRYGWTAGAGLETKFAQNWSAKVEYLYVDLGTSRVFIDNFGAGTLRGESIALRSHIVRAGLNYHFGEGLSLLPMLARAPSVNPLSWQGFYIGATLGGAIATARQRDTVTGFDSGRYNPSGSVFGATLGYNWLTGTTLIGLEADASWSAITGETSGRPGNACFGNPGTCGVELNWFATARARVGLPWDRLLPYLTGGFALGSLRGYEGDVLANGGFGAATRMRTGWTAGAGIEVMINERWSSKFEYLYVDLGRRHLFNDTLITGAVRPQHVSLAAHIIRTGLNYRFDWGAPLAARY